MGVESFETLLQTVAKTPVFVISKIGCGYCKFLKNDLATMDIPYEELQLDGSDGDYAAQRQEVLKFQQNTFPMVFVGGKLIGGYSEFTKLRATRKLHALLDALHVRYVDCNDF